MTSEVTGFGVLPKSGDGEVGVEVVGRLIKVLRDGCVVRKSNGA